MNLLEQFARHIEFLGHGTVADEYTSGDIFWGWTPDSPTECVTVFSSDSAYAGSPDGARIQMIVRGENPKSAYERSQAIVEDLVDFQGYLAGDGARVSIEVVNASTGIGSDNRKREMFTSNFRVYYCED